MTPLTFTVHGVAQPKGSARAFIPKGWKRAIVTSANPKNKGWQQLVAEAAGRAIEERPAGERGLYSGPVRLLVGFYLPRPKSLRQRVEPHTKKPDLDKLTRSVKDAMSKVVWQDDAQVIELKVTKAYAAPGNPPCAVISVTPLSEQDV